MPTLMSPHRSRDRILGYGASGSGKTQLGVDAGLNTNGKLWVVDTDRAWERTLDGMPELEDSIADLCDVRPTARAADKTNWAVATAALDEYSRKMERDDFLVVDMGTIMWPWCQAYFSQTVYGKSIEEFLIEARTEHIAAVAEAVAEGRKAPGESNAFEGKSDWPTINRTWDTQLVDPLLLANGHVIVTAEQAKLNTGDGFMADAPETQAMFMHIGQKPAGQKAFAHQFHTVLYLGVNMSKQWIYTTAKDRVGRAYQTHHPLGGGLVADYLKPVGGWKLEAAVKAAAKAKEATS